jgi:endonuclease III
MESKENKKIRAKKILSKLKKHYPFQPNLFLTHNTNAQMLCAIILSAQSTDAQINKLTKKLFKKYKTVNDFANVNKKEFEKEIYSSGFYKNKSKNIIACFKKINSDFNGKIPLTMPELLSLPGVGRKTANLVLLNNNIISGIAVDTHVARLTQRFGLTKAKTQDKIEYDLMEIYQKREWSNVNKLFISHGRAICTAKRSFCEKCFLNSTDLCLRCRLKKTS